MTKGKWKKVVIGVCYVSILERLDAGRLTVKQAQKEIEKAAKKKGIKNAKKFSIKIEAEEVRFRFSGLYIGLVNGVINIAKPIILLVRKKDDEANSHIRKEEMKLLIKVIQIVLKDFKNYPAMTLVSIKSKDTTVLIETK